ncbi:MAG TPA: pitrilysin family protein [Steroidobacteraceae bacterium]|jgi:zinc protease|nr:pitrilysin family protein [Steroidobacteraceae bacterium]
MRIYAAVALIALTGSAAAANMEDHAHRSKVDGIDLITYQSTVKDVVVILGVLPAGDAMAGSGNIAIPTLSGMMLDRGTKALDKFAIAEKLDNVGAEIGFTVGAQSLQIRAKCLKKDVPLVVGLIAAELRTPAMQLAEFTKAKQQMVGELEHSAQNTGTRALEAFDRAIFPAGHPNRPHALSEYIAAAKSANLEEVKAFQAKYYGPVHMTLVVAGDVSDAGTQAEVAKAFSGWSGGRDYVRPAKPAESTAASEVMVPLADKPSVSVLLGQATGLRYSDPDSLALRVGTAILGSGFTGRLMGSVRDKEGLTYGISASVRDDSIVDGAWNINASFAPGLLSKGVASTRRELDKWWKDGVTEQELATRKQGITGGYFVGLSTTSGLAGTILLNAQRGYDLSWLDGYPTAVKALTLAQVNTAIKARLNPSTMVLVEAGSVAAGGSTR